LTKSLLVYLSDCYFVFWSFLSDMNHIHSIHSRRRTAKLTSAPLFGASEWSAELGAHPQNLATTQS
jgi:hypothetical protein